MNSKTIIYARLSTNKQDIGMQVQIDALKSYCKMKQWHSVEIVQEIESGKTVIHREKLKYVLEEIEQGKVQRLLVYKLDRLGRKLKDILEMIETFKEKNVSFVSLVESFDTSTPSGIAFLQITGVFAELERNMISSRTRDALAMKKQQGVMLGRPSLIDDQLKKIIIAKRKARHTWKGICKELQLNYRTVRKCVKE